MKKLIGIDPGVTTGLAIYQGKLTTVTSGTFIEMYHLLAENLDVDKVRIEDARKRTWFGKAGRGQLQGAGSIKRDSKLWEEVCDYHGLDYELVHPKSNTTKLDAGTFKQITGWKGRTNEHKRDASMLVYGF